MELPQLSMSGPESLEERFTLLLGAQRDLAEKFLAERQQRIEQAGVFLQEQLQRLEDENGEARDEIGRLQAERDSLAACLAHVERTADDRRSSVDEDLSRRLETAMEDLREANEKNAELQGQLAKARSSAAKLAQQSRKPGWLDWETEKNRILAALEEDADENDEARKSERLGIEEVLRINDEIIGAKDREIHDLKQRLEQRVVHGIAPGESAVKQAINVDAVVQEERNRLQQLQKEWRERLREAEVELSLERAKIARDRAELDEQLRMTQESRSKPATANKPEESERASRGRWLAHLGLTAADREPSRR